MGNHQGNELMRNFLGNTPPYSSHLAEPLWTDPGRKGKMEGAERISSLKNKNRKSERNKEKVQSGNDLSNLCS